VHSWASTSCMGESGSTRTDVVAGWVLEQVASVHGSDDRCVAWDLYDDGVCDENCDDVDPDCVVDETALVNGLTDASSCATVARPTTWFLGMFSRR
jgi:hypothetical protein